MRVLLDHNLPHRLRHLLAGDVETVWHRRWERLRNGELLSAAEAAGFDILVTVDGGIPYQQNLSGRRIAVVQVVAPTNRLEDLLPILADLNEALRHVRPGTFTTVPAWASP